MAHYFAAEYVAAEVVLELRSAGLDVVHAKEVCPGASDHEVLRLAAEAGRVLATDDLGFGGLAVRCRQPAAGVILISVYELPPGSASAMPLRRSANCGTARSVILR